ncbi:hypothetical protein F2Q68_00044860 [Brassica cretica]|uniref:DUF3741 domain-containing protein n=1 Tax=Brassica cretica TaxID=69181 RepID=A0A8S9LN94_BRACR|nr:hypothetical protein F2Q68_00044860 [Brassica cretica]
MNSLLTRFRGYAGDESSSGSDSPSESELVPVTSRTRTAFNRKNYHRSSPSKSSTTSSVTREAKRRLSERWKLTHKYEQEIEIRRSGTLAEMLAASDREARPASFNGLVFEDGISKRVEWTELPEPVGISSRDGWKGLSSRSFSKSKTIMNQESTYGYTIVLPKELNYRDGLVKGSSSHRGESQSYLSSKSSRLASYKSHSSYNSSPEVNMSPSLARFLYMNDNVHQKEKLSPSKGRYSFSVDTEDDSSASDDMKTAMSSEAPDLSTVTSLTDPDISRMPTEDVNHSLVPEPQSRESSKEGDQPSPVSVLEASYDDDVSSSSECFESEEQKFKDVFEVLDAKRAEGNGNLYHQGRVKAANLTQAEMAFIRQKFMEAKRLSTDEKLRHSKEFNDALEALDSNKDLLLKFLQQPDSSFTKHLHDLQTTPHKPHYSQAPSLKCPNSQRHVDKLPHRHGGGSHTRHASYDTLDLPNVELGKKSELQPTNIVVLKPNLGEPRYAGRAFASPSSSSDEFRADRRLLPCTTNHVRQKSNEDNGLSRRSSRDSGELSKIMSRQRKASCSSAMSFEASGFRGYAGDESSSGSDSASESELVPVTSRARTAFNRKNYHRSLPSKSSSTTSSVSREAKRRLSERWKLTHKYEQEMEISRSGTLAEMLATSDREARPASFNGLSFEEGISKRDERKVQLSELPEPVGISSRDGWKGSSSRSFSKSKTIMSQESTYGYTIVLPKELISRDGLVKGSSSHHSFLSSKSSRPDSNSSPEVNRRPSLTKFLYMNHEIHQKEKLSPSKAGCSFSVDADSDTGDSSASGDIKTALSSEAPNLSTVTSLTDPDVSKMATEDVNHSSVPEPQSRESSKEGDQPSPVSVLEASFDDDEVSSSSECFESVSADLQGSQ